MLSQEERKGRARVILRELVRLFPNPKTQLHFRNQWQLLVAIILSAQTTDKQVNRVTKVLFQRYRTREDYTRVDQKTFARTIQSIGLYRIKAQNILKSAKMIQKKFHGRIPKSLAELTTLPGVGRKTANVFLGVAHNTAEGIAVDTHVARLSRLFGLTEQSDPKKIEQDLMKLIPQNEWVAFTHRMILYGRAYCSARCTHTRCPIMLHLKPLVHSSSQ